MYLLKHDSNPKTEVMKMSDRPIVGRESEMGIQSKLKILHDALFLIQTEAIAEIVKKYGGDATTLLSEQREKSMSALMSQIKNTLQIVGRGIDVTGEFYQNSLPILGFEFDVKKFGEGNLTLKITHCPAFERGKQFSKVPLCNFICIPASSQITDALAPNHQIELASSMWEGAEFCRIDVKEPPKLMGVEQVLDIILNLEPFNCPTHGPDYPCVFSDEICEHAKYQEFRVSDGVAKKTINSAVLSLAFPVKDEFDLYILNKLTRKLGEKGVFTVLEKPEPGYNLSLFFMSETGIKKQRVKNTVLNMLSNLKSFLAEARVTVHSWIDKKRTAFKIEPEEEPEPLRKISKIVVCPHCSSRIQFTIDKSNIEKAEKFPVSVVLKHEDHSFTVYLDSNLLISEIRKEAPPRID